MEKFPEPYLHCVYLARGRWFQALRREAVPRGYPPFLLVITDIMLLKRAALERGKLVSHALDAGTRWGRDDELMGWICFCNDDNTI